MIAPCPFCASEKVSTMMAGDMRASVGCIDCGANGPWVSDENQAERLWNVRHSFRTEELGGAPGFAITP